MYDVFTFEEQSKQFVINEQQSYILAYWSMEPICHNILLPLIITENVTKVV